MTDFNSQMNAVLANNGVSVEKDFAMVNIQALIFLMQASKSGFAKAILPESMVVISSEDDVDAGLERIVAEEAFAVANLRALAKYVEAKFAGNEHDTAAVEQFYELYKTSSDEDKFSAQVGTLRLLDQLMSDEVNRVGGHNGELSTSKEFDEMLEQFEGQGVAPLYHNIQPVAEFVYNIAQVIFKATEMGKTVTEARDANRKVGMINTMLLKQQLGEVGGFVVKTLFKTLLPEDQFQLVEAIGEREEARLESGDASVQH